MTAPFTLREIDHVVLRIADLRRSLDFYVGVLGCTVERHQEKIGLMQLRAGRSLIDLVALDGKLGRMGGAGAGEEGRNMDHLCLRVDPFDEKSMIAYLLAAGLCPGTVEQRFGAEGEGPSIYLNDPDGNAIELKGPPA